MDTQKNKMYNELTQKKQMKPRKKHKRVFFWIKLFLVLTTFIIIAISLALSPFCNIKKIEVQDSQYYDRDDIISAADISIDENGFKTFFKNINAVSNVFRLRFGVSEQKILNSHPYFKTIEVKYAIPSEIKVSFTQRKPICSMVYLGTNLLMDNEGYIVDTKETLENINLPQINGISFDGFELGKTLTVKNSQSMDDAVKLIMSIIDSDSKDSFKMFDKINAINVSDSSRIYLFVDNRLKVNFGSLSELEYKIGFLKQIYYKKLKKEDKGMLDISTGNNPSFIPEK